MSLSLFLSRLLKETSRPRALLTTIIFFSCMQSPWSVLLAQNIPSAPASQAAPAQAVHLQDYSKPRAPFPHILQSYEAQKVPPPVFSNSPRIDSLLRDGKIYLSIDDAVALTLENNLDLDIARYNLNIADTDYLRAKSGANILGVNAGIVQNTPGGGVGGLGGTVGSGTGGTTVAASGIGTGTNGLVSSTLGIGAPITSFDPSYRARCNSIRTMPNRSAYSVRFRSLRRIPIPQISLTLRALCGAQPSAPDSTIPTSRLTIPPACSLPI